MDINYSDIALYINKERDDKNFVTKNLSKEFSIYTLNFGRIGRGMQNGGHLPADTRKN